MIEIYESTMDHFCDKETYKVEADVMFWRKDLEEYVINLRMNPLDKQTMISELVTTNPYGGATHSSIANTIREIIGDYFEQYGIDNTHIENKDLKYIFRHSQKKKVVGVTFIISKERLRFLALRYPEFHQAIRPKQ